MIPRPKAAEAARFYDPGRYVVGDSVGFLLNQLVLSMRRQITLAMGEHDLTAAQWMPLWKLRLNGPCAAQELAREMEVDAGAMTRLIDRLVAKGLVQRARSTADRRVITLSVTAAGKALADELPAVLAKVNNAYLGGFDRNEWEILKGLLRRMLANGQTLPTSCAPSTTRVKR